MTLSITQRAAMQAALDALSDCRHGCEEPHNTVSAITALRAALDEPVVEPVAEVKVKMTGGNAGIATVIHEIHDPLREPLPIGTKLYASPPPPAEVPLLADIEIGMQMAIAWGHTSIAPRQAPTFARAIEALVRQKAGL